MNNTLKILSMMVVSATFAINSTAQAEMFWSDNSLSVLKNQSEYEVNTHDDVTVITLEHASGHNWGDVFFFADRLDFKKDADHFEIKETYVELAPRLSLSYLTANKIEIGIISDVFIATTWEHDTISSDVFSDSFDNYLVGVGVNLTMPGFAHFSVNVYQANNENIDNDEQLTVVWGLPFSIADVDFMLDGYIDWSSAQDSHAADFHFNPQLKLDVGKFFGVPKKFEAGIEYSYWHNKFGISGVDNESMFSWMIKVHL